MISSEVQVGKHYLYPSNLFVSKNPYIVTTVLGSCISICLVDQKNHYGGINHFMLPLWNGEGLASAKYGNIAMEKLLSEMMRLGSRKDDLVAKMFGGANLVNLTMNVGERNADMARGFLAENNIRIVGESIGGIRGRKILFDTYSGQVQMRFIQQTHNLKHRLD